MKFYKINLVVEEKYIDGNLHVNNLEYIKWAQYISGKHWDNVATEKIKQEYRWVVVHQEINYFKELILNDEIEITTWIEKIEKAKTFRIVEIFNKTKNEMAAKAIITWYAIDKITNKPKRISEEAKVLFE